MRKQFFKNTAIFTSLLAIYFVTGKLGLKLAFLNASVTAVWPPTGIAIAAFLLFGYRVWPSIFTGAFLVNITTAGSVAACLGVSAGNTLEGIIGAYFINRFANGRRAFERPQDILKFAVLAGMLSTMVSATMGVGSLFLGGFVKPVNCGPTWLTWWLGDMAGDFMMAPLIILWAEDARFQWEPKKYLEALFVIGSLCLVSWVVFWGVYPLQIKNYPLEFLTFPIILWTIFRFGRRETAVTTFLLFIIATSGTLYGFGPFIQQSLNEALLLLQAYLGFVSISALIVAAVVSQRKTAEQALLYLSSIVKSSEDAILGKTLKGIITSWNKGAERMYGYTAEEIIGSPASRIVPLEYLSEVDPILERLAQGEVIEQFETKRLCKDGTVIDVSITLSPILDPAGKVVGASAIARNITERKKLETQKKEQAQALEKSNLQLARREKIMKSLLEDLQASKTLLEEQKRSLQEVNERLESLGKLKDEFVATASHELRTPLTVIREGISLIHDRILGPINEEQYEFLTAVDENIDRLTGLIDNILDLAKIEAGRLALVRKRVSVGNLIQSSIENYQNAAGKRKIRVEIAQVPDVFADPNRILQVLWNLFSNAVKFTKDNGTIIFKVENQPDGFVAVSIEDNGVGITKEDLPKLFQKFSQVGKKLSHGTGLGLALCKEITELHKGNIWATTELGRRSQFIFNLPVYTKEFVLEQCFEEQFEIAKRSGKQTFGMLVFNAASFLPERQEDSSAGHVKRLEQIVDFFRRGVYSSDSVVAIEPSWIVVIAATDMKGFRSMADRLSSMLDDWAETLIDKPASFSKDFGIAVYPADGKGVFNLFEAAKSSLSRIGVNHG